MENYKLDYPDMYPELDEDKTKKIFAHCNRYNIEPVICAYYEDWEDFCSDWCDHIGYTRTEARDKLHGGIGEFMIFEGWGILRFVI